MKPRDSVAVLPGLEVTCLLGPMPGSVWLWEKTLACGDAGEQHSFPQPEEDAGAPSAPENSQHPARRVV